MGSPFALVSTTMVSMVPVMGVGSCANGAAATLPTCANKKAKTNTRVVMSFRFFIVSPFLSDLHFHSNQIYGLCIITDERGTNFLSAHLRENHGLGVDIKTLQLQ